MNIKKPFGLSSITFLITAFAAAKFIVHILTAQNYGYFCDELYTIALSKHLAFGYVDLPPLVPAVCALGRAIFGESLLGVHILPALAGSATLVFTCLITKELGGKLFAIGLSALGFITAPAWLSMNSFFGYDGFDQFALSVFLFVLVRLIKTENKKLWVPLGLIAGIAFMCKATILFLGPGFVAALIIFRHRRHLLTVWPWIGAGVFILTISPYVIWEYLNKWPTIEYWTIYGSERVYNASITEYLVNIIMIMSPFLFPVLAIGLYRIFKPFCSGNFSYLGVMFLITLATMFALKAKAYMLSEMFIPLIAAGSIFIDEKLSNSKRLKWLGKAIIAWLLAWGILISPYSLPLLPPEQFDAYFGVFSANKMIKMDKLPKIQIPQTLADRFGWDNLVRTVATVYNELSPEEQKNCGILADWYGPAAAIDLLGSEYGLPHAVCGHLTYYLWGPGEYSWDVMIAVSGNYSMYKRLFKDVTLKALIKSDYTMPGNTNLPVLVCRNPRMPVDKIWQQMKSYH